MTAVIAPIPVGARLVDLDERLDAAGYARLKAAGIDGVLVYLGQATKESVEAAMDAGLGVKPVMFAESPGWHPSAQHGAERGARAVIEAQGAGFLLGIDITIDLEGVDGSAEDTAEDVDAIALQLVQANFLATLYVGAQSVLNAAQLYARPHVTRYHRSFSMGIPEPMCGFALIQLWPTVTIAGHPVDIDVAQEDHRGRSAMWMIKQPSPTAGGMPLPFSPFTQPPSEAA